MVKVERDRGPGLDITSSGSEAICRSSSIFFRYLPTVALSLTGVRCMVPSQFVAFGFRDILVQVVIVFFKVTMSK